MEKKLEMFANAAIIVVALLVIGVFGYSWFSSNSQIKQIQIGSTINLPDTVFTKEQSLLIVLHKDCKYCSESSAFYQNIVKSAKNNPKTGLIALLPTPIEISKQYLKELNVQIEDIKQVNLEQLQVQGTPTLILIDKQGKVLNSWVGKLPPEVESEVINKVL